MPEKEAKGLISNKNDETQDGNGNNQDDLKNSDQNCCTGCWPATKKCFIYTAKVIPTIFKGRKPKSNVEFG